MLSALSRSPVYLTVLYVSTLGILVAAGAIGIALQDITRAYVGGSGFYSRGHMAAMSALQEFSRTGDPVQFRNYETGIEIPFSDGRARRILEDTEKDRESSHVYLVGGLNHPDDVAGMSWMFRMFEDSPLFAPALATWQAADADVLAFRAAAEELKVAVTGAGVGSAEAQAAMERLWTIDARLRTLENDFIVQLSDSARVMARIMIYGLIGLGLLLGGVAVFFVTHALRKMRSAADARRMALDHARSQRSLLETTLENLDEGVTFFDADLRLLLMNRRAAELLHLPEGQFGSGTPLEEFLRFNWRQGEYEDVDEDTHVAEQLRMVRMGTVQHYKRERPDGSVIEVARTPVPTGGFVTAYRDISNEERSRKALAASQQRTREVIDRSKDAFVSMDEDGRVFDWNPAAEEIFGWSRSEAIGELLTDLFVPVKDDEESHAVLKRFLDTGDGRKAGRRFETVARDRDGHRFPVEVTLGTQVIEGRPVFNAFIWDISERRRTEEELTAARDNADIANRAKSEFLANMSHELRTPLNAIIGFSEMMKLEIGTSLDQRGMEYAGNILDSGRHLLALINDILDISRVEIGRVDMDETVFSLNDAVGSCLKLLQHTADRNDIRFENLVAGRSMEIKGDIRLVRQILLNLMGNAVKFSGEGTCVRIWAESDADHVSIFVGDEGPGMDPESAQSIFSPFVQLSETIANAQGGAGLGLSIVKRFAELHQGSAAVSTALGRGTTIEVRLPADRLVTPAEA